MGNYAGFFHNIEFFFFGLRNLPSLSVSDGAIQLQSNWLSSPKLENRRDDKHLFAFVPYHRDKGNHGVSNCQLVQKLKESDSFQVTSLGADADVCDKNISTSCCYSGLK